MNRRIPSSASLVCLDVCDYLPAPLIIPGKPGQVTFCAYLGRGAFGAVYSGKYGFLKVAIKIYKNLPSHKPFLREVDCLLQVGQHENVLGVVGFGNYQGVHHDDHSKSSYFMVSEYIGTSTLRSLMSDYCESQLVFHEKARICLELLRGLAHLHKCGCAHHDLKPENILISDTGSHAAIADFGMATLANVHSSDFRKQGKGTVSYAPPEAFSDAMSEISDVWSLGVLFFEWLSHGELPFFGKHENDLRNAIKNSSPSPFNQRYHVPDVWQSIILTNMLNKNPKERWSAQRVVDALTNVKLVKEVEPFSLYCKSELIMQQMREIFVSELPEEEKKIALKSPHSNCQHANTTPLNSVTPNKHISTHTATTTTTTTTTATNSTSLYPQDQSCLPTVTLNPIAKPKSALPAYNNVRKRRNGDGFFSDFVAVKRKRSNIDDMIISSVAKHH